METITLFGTIYFSGSRHIFIACCQGPCVQTVFLGLFIKTQVPILAEEGDQQELINSKLMVSLMFLNCQCTGCIQHSKSLGNHKPANPALPVQLYILWKDRFPWFGCTVTCGGEEVGASTGLRRGLALLTVEPAVWHHITCKTTLHFSLP